MLERDIRESKQWPKRARSTTRSGTATSSTQPEDGTCLLYIDLHLVHEVTSPQAFEGLRLAGRKVRRPDATIAVADHNVPTTDRSQPASPTGDPRIQVETLEQQRREFGVPYYRHGRHPPGHRPHHRARAGLHPAGHDDRLRRQPHLDPRRLRRAGLRHRHSRGRARAGDPDAAPDAGRRTCAITRRRRPAPASPPRT